MKMKNLLSAALLFASLACSTSCNENKTDGWAPYAGCAWSAEWGADTVFLELLSAHDVTLYAKNGSLPPAYGKYETRRFKFPFSDFSFEDGAVKYNLCYAVDKSFNIMLCGDSLNAECDTAYVQWSKPFIFVEPQ